MIVQSFGVLDAQAVLRDERITGVDPPLLVKRRDATAAAIGNHITNPLRIQRPCSGPLSPPDISQTGKKLCFGNRNGPKAGS